MDLNALLNRVAVGDATTKEAEATIKAELKAARRPAWVFVVGLVLVLGPLGYMAKSCADESVIKTRSYAAEKAAGCSCNCTAEWEKARQHYAKEMLRGLRLRVACGVLESENP